MSFHRGLCVVSLLLFASGAEEASAQIGLDPVHPTPVVMLGYVVNAPSQLLGGGGAFLPPGLGGWGLYADAKTRATGLPTDDDWYFPDVTPEEAAASGHLPQDERSVWTSYNVALVRAFRPDLIVYLGGGASREEVYLEYFDTERDLADYGYYWIPDAEAEGWKPNVMGGMFFRVMRHVAIQVGAEMRPPGFTVGILGVL